MLVEESAINDQRQSQWRAFSEKRSPTRLVRRRFRRCMRRSCGSCVWLRDLGQNPCRALGLGRGRGWLAWPNPGPRQRRQRWQDRSSLIHPNFTFRHPACCRCLAYTPAESFVTLAHQLDQSHAVLSRRRAHERRRCRCAGHCRRQSLRHLVVQVQQNTDGAGALPFCGEMWTRPKILSY